MAFNPFKENGMPIDKMFINWNKMYPESYDKHTVDPYTRLRVILLNGAEYEANWFMHEFNRNCNNNDIRRDLAFIRRTEKQQQMRISDLKPIDEDILETTIGYEQLAVDLTATLAKTEPDPYVKATLDFALLEDFDHLYRYSDLLEFDSGIHAETIVGGYTEIMPARPTISEHRYPRDDIRYSINFDKADPLTKLNTNIITAAEQQTMNYYMNIGCFYKNDYGRQLFQEIGLIEEQHVSSYGSLLDTSCTWLENLLMHEYTECYLYYSCMTYEKDPKIKKIWQQHLEQEITHLHLASEMLKKYENKEWQQVFTCGGDFPMLLNLEPQIDYIRGVIENTVTNTGKCEDFVDVNDLPPDYAFFDYQHTVNGTGKDTPSHKVIQQKLDKDGQDYRYTVDQHPIKELQDRTKDNTKLGRVQTNKK